MKILKKLFKVALWLGTAFFWWLFLVFAAAMIIYWNDRNFAILFVGPSFLATVGCLVASLFVARSERKQEELLSTPDKKRLSLKARRRIFVSVTVSVAVALAVIVAIPSIHEYKQERQPFNEFRASECEMIRSGNNFQHGGMIDYQSGKLGYIMQDGEEAELYVIDEKGERTQIKGVCAPFAFCGNHIVYIKDKALRLHTKGMGDTVIASEADSFAVWNETVIWCVGSGIYAYDTLSASTKTYTDDSQQYVVYSDDLYILDNDGNIAVIDLISHERETLGKVEALAEHNRMQVMEGTIVLYRQRCFELIDIKTWLSREIPIETDAQSCDAFSFICSDTEIVYSYRTATVQATCQIDITSDERRMFSDEYYEKMYFYKKLYESEDRWYYFALGVQDAMPCSMPYISMLEERIENEEIETRTKETALGNRQP